MTKPNARHESLRTLALKGAASTVIPPARETVSVAAAVALGDVPILIERPKVNEEDLELTRLLDAIDGYVNVAALAAKARLDVQQTRALLADLSLHGFVALDRPARTSSSVEQVTATSQNKGLEHLLQGLRPRTK